MGAVGTVTVNVGADTQSAINSIRNLRENIGTADNDALKQADSLIQLWSTNPPQDISYEEVQDIQSGLYGMKTDNLSNSERQQLADIIYNEVVSNGATASNSMATVDAINNGQMAQISLNGLTSDDLKVVARLGAKIHTTASMFAFEDALKLLGYYNK